MSGGSSGVAPSSTGTRWTIFCTTSLWASSKASCAYGKSRACATMAIRRQVITIEWDLRDIEVAYRMFERWRQENFFSTCEKSSCSMR